MLILTWAARVIRTRRHFFGLASLLAANCLIACNSDPATPDRASGRLSARPQPPTRQLAPGRHALNLGSSRDGFIYIPANYQHGRPTPLLVLFHGAGRRATEWQGAFPNADSLGIVLVVPDSRAVTWDVVHADFGPDVEFLDQALEFAFRHVSVDPARLGLGGFSDGATYALSLGLSNGDFITHILSFSPGFIAPGELLGKPLIGITHGTNDGILPIAQTSRLIVPALRADGYTVLYQEFTGTHELPTNIAIPVLQWFLRGTPFGQ